LAAKPEIPAKEGGNLGGFGAMLSIKRILLPVDIPIASLGVIHQAATLAHHFKSEIVILHVVTAESRAASELKDNHSLTDEGLLAVIKEEAQARQDQSLGPELDGLTIQCMTDTGDAARVILQTAGEEKADLIMMSSYGFAFYQFLMGSVAAKVLHEAECPVWTDAHVKESHVPELAIRNVLGAVEFGPRAEVTVSWAAQMAAEFGAHLTLANVTASVEFWGPGGIYVNEEWKKELVGDASEQMARLQKYMGTKADVFIGSGDVPKALSQAAKQTKADLMVTGCYPYSGNLGIHGYGIICAVPIPVLSV
jgi:nucleotide-binding universal stress UspA family protein